MDRILLKEKVITTKIHKFYCDKCDTFLGESEEYDDGYFNNQFGKLDATCNISFRETDGYITDDYKTKRLEYHAVLCPKCREEFLSKVTDAFDFLIT